MVVEEVVVLRAIIFFVLLHCRVFVYDMVRYKGAPASVFGEISGSKREREEYNDDESVRDSILECMRKAMKPHRLLVEYLDYQFMVREPNAMFACLELEVRKANGIVIGSGGRKKTLNDYAPPKPLDGGLHIYVAQLRKCPPKFSGPKLMTELLPELEACVPGAQSIGLLDAAAVYLNQLHNEDPTKLIFCTVEYSPYLILATGETYYNQFGFYSPEHDEETQHNAALIDDESFENTVTTLLTRFKADLAKAAAPTTEKGEQHRREMLQLARTVERDVLQKPDSLRNLFGIAHLDYASSTTHQIFAALRKDKELKKMTLSADCSDPPFVWLDAVIMLFVHAGGGLRFDRYVEKSLLLPAAPPPPMSAEPISVVAMPPLPPSPPKKRIKGGRRHTQQRRRRLKMRRRRVASTTIRKRRGGR